MTVLVAGSRGFLGSEIWRSLQRAGVESRRLCRDRECTSDECLHWRGDRAEFASAALAAEVSGLVLAENSYIAHETPEWFHECWQANVEFRRAVLPALAGLSGLTVVSLTSYLRVTEPEREYSRAKEMAAQETWAFARSVLDARMAELMIFDTFGTEDPRPKLIELALTSELVGKSLQVRMPDAPMLVTSALVIGRVVVDLVTNGEEEGSFLVTGESWTPGDLVALIHERVEQRKVGADMGPLRLRTVPSNAEQIGAIFDADFDGWDVIPGLVIEAATSVDAFLRERIA